MPISNYLQDRILQTTLQGDIFTWPTALYVGLHTADPTGDNTTALANEVSGNAYVRQAVTFTEPDITYKTENTADLTFGPATPSGWGLVTFISIWDAGSSGNMLYYGAISTPTTINTSDSFLVVTGTLTVQFIA